MSPSVIKVFSCQVLALRRPPLYLLPARQTSNVSGDHPGVHSVNSICATKSVPGQNTDYDKPELRIEAFLRAGTPGCRRSEP